MRRPAPGGRTPWGPTSLGNPGCHWLCLCSWSGWQTRDASLRQGCSLWQEEDRTQTNSGTTVSEVLNEGWKEVSNTALLGSYHSRARANDLEMG